MNIKVYWKDILIVIGGVIIFWYFNWGKKGVESSRFNTLIVAEKQLTEKADLSSFIAYGRSLDTAITSLSVLRDSLQERFFYKLSREAAKRHGTNWKILYGVWMRESRMDPDAKGDGRKDSTGAFIPGTWKAFGLGQVHVASAKIHYDKSVTKERLLDPIENGYASEAILADYKAIFKDLIYGIASYQAGPENIQADFKAKRPPKNWRYVSDVLLIASEVKD